MSKPIIWAQTELKPINRTANTKNFGAPNRSIFPLLSVRFGCSLAFKLTDLNLFNSNRTEPCTGLAAISVHEYFMEFTSAQSVRPLLLAGYCSCFMQMNVFMNACDL